MHYFPLPRLFLSVLVVATLVTFSFFISNSFITQASHNDEAKLDADLRKLYRQRSGFDQAALTEERKSLRERIRFDEKQNSVGVIIKLSDDSEGGCKEIEAKGFHLRARFGDVAVADIAFEDLPKLAMLGAVKNIQAAKYKTILREQSSAFSLQPSAFINDSANTAINAPQARTNFNVNGSGVIVGMIDSGIDWRHQDFRTADGKTRIKALWDMSDPAGTGPGGVGRIYTEAEINAALQNNGTINERDPNGHGTHVAGTAAGNGLGTSPSIPVGTFAGVAPAADLIVVKATRSTNEQATFADDDVITAMSFVRNQATALNQPFVINLSLGGHFSAHDGTDSIELAIDNLLSSGTGRQVVVAAGNEGNAGIHAGGILAENSEVTIPFTVTSRAQGMLAVYQGADTISAKIIKPNGAVVGPAALYDLITSDSDVELENAPGETATRPKAVIVTFKQRLAGTWKLVLRGTRINNGHYDVWTQDAGETQLDASVRDGMCSVASPATTRRGISVGNFVSKTDYVDMKGTPRNRTGQGSAGQLAISSSSGPSRDGRLMPMLVAPGSYVASTRSADYTIDSFTGGAVPAEFLTNDGGKHYVAFGSSMSAATVTGTVALMLQANRNLSPEQIRRLLLRTVGHDNFTGAAASPQFGYGKLNALEAVRAAVENISATEIVSVSGASFVPEAVGAPEMIMSGFGTNLSGATAAAISQPLPTTLAEVSLRVTDSAGVTQLAPLFYVSPAQINYLIPTTAAVGTAKIEIVKTDGSVLARGSVSVNAVWPGMFSTLQNGRGIAAADVLRIKANDDRTYESINNPINLFNSSDKVYLQLYGTGLRGRSNLNQTKITLGGTPLAVEYVGSQNFYAGVDQINVVLPASLAGRNRTLDLVIYVDGWAANIVQCKIQ